MLRGLSQYSLPARLDAVLLIEPQRLQLQVDRATEPK
jgi:hypothetical protein